MSKFIQHNNNTKFLSSRLWRKPVAAPPTGLPEPWGYWKLDSRVFDAEHSVDIYEDSTSNGRFLDLNDTTPVLVAGLIGNSLRNNGV